MLIPAVIFTTVWFTLADKQKQSKCPWTANSINKLWYTHNGIWFGPSKTVILTRLQCGRTLCSFILSEINQTKKGETFCDSTSMRYLNKSNPKPEKAESDSQGSKTVHVSWNLPSFPWGKWLPMTSPKPIIQIIGRYIQSNECRHNFTINTNLTQTSQQTKGKTVSMVSQLCLKLYLQYLNFAYEI